MSALKYISQSDKDSGSSFHVELERSTREPKSWKEECYAAARAIANRADKPLVLCFSGNLKSEVMCRAFFDQGIHFSTITIAHSEDANRADVEQARKWCWQRDIEHQILPFDTRKFFNETIDSYVREGHIAANGMHFFQLALLDIVEGMGGCAVIGLGGLEFRAKATTPETYVRFSVGEYAVHKHSRQSETLHRPFFFNTTPELLLSYLRIPIVSQATAEPSLFYHDFAGGSFKRFISLSQWPEVSARTHYLPFGEFHTQRVTKEAELRRSLGSKFERFTISVRDLAAALEKSV
jgi:hypothetical protein